MDRAIPSIDLAVKEKDKDMKTTAPRLSLVNHRSQVSVLIFFVFTCCLFVAVNAAGVSFGASPGQTQIIDGCRCRSPTKASHPELECRCDTSGLVSLSPNLPPDVTRITVTHSERFVTLNRTQLQSYSAGLVEIVLSDLPEFREIENGTFSDLRNLTTIYIHDAPALVRLSDDAFKGHLPKLKVIKIHHTSLEQAPTFSALTLEADQLLHSLDLENNKIKTIKPGWIQGLKVEYLVLSYNQIEEIGPHAFNGATIARLTLKGNHHLKTLHPDAFVGIEHLLQLDLAETSITQLPTQGLKHIESLRLQNVFSLTTIPSIYHFQDLKEALLTYPYHCCAFHSPEHHDPVEFVKYQEFLGRMQEKCPADKRELHEHEVVASVATAVTYRARRQTSLVDENSTTIEPYVFDPDFPDKEIFYSTGTILGPAELDDFGMGVFHESLPGPPPSLIKLCGNVTVRTPLPAVNCTPMPDAFSPCEDIMGTVWLRVGVWIVVALALVGNTAVLLVLILAPGRMSVQRFLMANLSLADLSMGLYLLMVASEDLVSLGTYFNYAIGWQQGWGCQLAGFLTVFASELSVFTLAVITGERWYALTRAIHLTRRLTIVGAAELMAAGWTLALILAILPLVGVSSYSRVSICLPMDGSTPEAIGYLVFLLLFNGVAFFLVALAYFHMYRAVASHGNARESSHTASDAAVAKKMALLVFTDFACWAPVAFFGLTAVSGHPLIGVTDSKILLVFFYPLNACCNPYLYAILTKQYRRDLLLLLSRYGLCPKRAARFKTGLTSGHSGHTMQTVLRVGGGSVGGGSVVETHLARGKQTLSTRTRAHGRSDEEISTPRIETTFSFVPEPSGLTSNVNGSGQTYQYRKIPTEDEETT